MHPLTGQRLDLWRLKNFDGVRLPSPEDTYLFHLGAKDNPADERLFAMAEVRDLTPLRDGHGKIVGFPTIERLLAACLDGCAASRQTHAAGQRLDHNRVFLYAWPSIELPLSDIAGFAKHARAAHGRRRAGGDHRAGRACGAGGRCAGSRCGSPTGRRRASGHGHRPADRAAGPLDEYTQKVQRSGARGTAYPYEIMPLLAGPAARSSSTTWTTRRVRPGGPAAPGRTRPASSPAWSRTPTERYPEGMTRVALFGDPTKALGTVAEAECACMIAAIDLAEEPACRSSGSRCPPARRSRWTAAPRTWTGSPGRCAGSSCSPRPAARSTSSSPASTSAPSRTGTPKRPCCMHTKGILVMTPDSAMVLTGKQSLDYSGGVSAEDNFGIGGYDRVMGPNGQAQYWAPNLTGRRRHAVRPLRARLRRAGRAVPAARRTSDPLDRDVRTFPHRTRTASSPRSARSSPRRPTRSARSRSTSVR